jgi:phage-related protein
VSQAVTFFASLGPKIASACSNFGSILISAGKALMDGLLNGIKAGAEAVFSFVSGIAGKIAALKGPLPYDKKVLVPNGEALMEGLQKGIESGAEDVYSLVKTIAQAIFDAMKESFGGMNVGVSLAGATQGLSAVNSQMKTMASTATDVNKSMAGVVPSGKMNAETKSQMDALKYQKDTLDLKVKELQVAKDLAATKDDKKAVQEQINALNAQKRQLALQQEQLEYSNKYGESVGQTNSQYDDMIKKAGDMPTDFAKATGQQFMSDLGISGQGVIPQLLEKGSQYIFQVANMDTALSAQQTVQRKQALGLVGR